MQTSDSQQKIKARYSVLLVLWFAIFMSLATLVVIVNVVPGGTTHDVKLSLVLNSLGLAPFALSFFVKQVLLSRAVESQRLELVQSAYVIAFALSEAPSLLGLVDRFVTGSNYYFLGFTFAALGMLLHFPQKKHLLDASYKEG